jgi:hypothetical protein
MKSTMKKSVTDIESTQSSLEALGSHMITEKIAAPSRPIAMDLIMEYR